MCDSRHWALGQARAQVTSKQLWDKPENIKLPCTQQRTWTQKTRLDSQEKTGMRWRTRSETRSGINNNNIRSYLISSTTNSTWVLSSWKWQNTKKKKTRTLLTHPRQPGCFLFFFFLFPQFEPHGNGGSMQPLDEMAVMVCTKCFLSIQYARTIYFIWNPSTAHLH